MAERRSDIDEISERLMLLGATDEEIANLVGEWDEIEREEQQRLLRLNDVLLRQELHEGRTAVLTEDEEAECLAQEQADALENEYDDQTWAVLAGTVEQILEWVNTDGEQGTLEGQPREVKAARALRLEGSTETPRTTLIKALEDIAQ